MSHESGAAAARTDELDRSALVAQLQDWGRALGFSQIGIAPIDLHDAEPGLQAWLEAGFHGGMDYMARHGLKRARPAELVPGTVSVISARMDYLPRATPEGWQTVEWQGLRRPERAQVSLYARGRDYHKVLRARLQQLADRLAEAIGPFGQRCFTDSAPVLEVELAKRASLGWRGKHTLLLSREAGSMFFLGEIYVSLALPPSPPLSSHCGQCSACIEVCPTQAIVAPYRLDARRCISYLTIEHEGEIPEALRAPSATACTAATTASSPAPGTSTRRAARCPTSTPARASAAPSCSACGAGARPSSCAAPRARRSAASATCAGAATWRW
jgi:epoxyqueuosine reductase